MSADWILDETVETSVGTVAAARFGRGPALVLAHGWPWSSYSWHRVAPALAERFTVHVYDMPGFGRSAKPNAQSTAIDVQGSVFGEMLDHWALDRPRVVAHDFGGAVTLRAHLLHGRDFERYVLVNVVAMRPWGSALFEHVGRHVAAFEGLPPHIHAALVYAYIGGALAHPLPQEDRDALAAPWLSDDGRISFYRQFAQADERFTAEMEDRFRSVRCPSSVIWGADDPWIPLDRGRALHARLPNADLVVLDGVGHLPQLEAPERVAAHLIAAL